MRILLKYLCKFCWLFWVLFLRHVWLFNVFLKFKYFNEAFCRKYVKWRCKSIFSLDIKILLKKLKFLNSKNPVKTLNFPKSQLNFLRFIFDFVTNFIDWSFIAPLSVYFHDNFDVGVSLKSSRLIAQHVTDIHWWFI